MEGCLLPVDIMALVNLTRQIWAPLRWTQSPDLGFDRFYMLNFLLVFSLSHHVLFGFIRGELLTWTWSIFLPFDFPCLFFFVCWWLPQILPTWSLWLTGVWPHHNDLDRDWESARGNGWKRTRRHQQGALGRPGLGGDQVKHEDGDLIRDRWRFHLAGAAHRRPPAGFYNRRWHGQLLWSAQVIISNKK